MKENKLPKLDYFKVQKLIKEIFEKEGPNRPKGPNPEAYKDKSQEPALDGSNKDEKEGKNKKKGPTFPMQFILYKFPNIKVVLTELLTTTFSDYIDNIYVMAPKPTTFKVVLKNKQDFLIIYNERSYIVKVAGKKYYMLNLGERERAIKAVAELLNTKRFITSNTEEDKNAGPDNEKGAKLGRPKGSGGGGSSSSPSPSDDDEKLPELPDDILKGLEGDEDEGEDKGDITPDEEPISENFKIRLRRDNINDTINLLESFSNNLELETFQQQLSEDKEVEEITAEEAANKIVNASNMFTVEFTKKDGTHRVLNGRRGVKKHLKGGTLGYNPQEKRLISVYDIHAAGYRMIPQDSIVAVRINGKNYRIVPNKPMNESKLSNEENILLDNMRRDLKQLELSMIKAGFIQ